MIEASPTQYLCLFTVFMSVHIIFQRLLLLQQVPCIRMICASHFNTGFCSGGMFCTLSDVDFGKYLLQKVMDFMKQHQPRTLRAVGNVGQQESTPPIYVLSPEVSPNLLRRGRTR